MLFTMITEQYNKPNRLNLCKENWLLTIHQSRIHMKYLLMMWVWIYNWAWNYVYYTNTNVKFFPDSHYAVRYKCFNAKQVIGRHILKSQFGICVFFNKSFSECLIPNLICKLFFFLMHQQREIFLFDILTVSIFFSCL